MLTENYQHAAVLCAGAAAAKKKMKKYTAAKLRIRVYTQNEQHVDNLYYHIGKKLSTKSRKNIKIFSYFPRLGRKRFMSWFVEQMSGKMLS